jgi:hypothetical protein
MSPKDARAAPPRRGSIQICVDEAVEQLSPIIGRDGSRKLPGQLTEEIVTMDSATS